MTEGAGNEQERFEVQRTIPAEPAAIFAVVSSPEGHVAIDASGMLQSWSGEPAKAEGDTFVIHMDREALGDLPMGKYDVTVTFTSFEPDRSLTWEVSGEGFPSIGHYYGYRLEPVDGGTLVTSIYDWSGVGENWKAPGVWPIIPESALKATLGILERTVRAQGGGVTEGTLTEEQKEAIKARYAAERAKRLRPEGNQQYLQLKDQLAHYLDDPYLPIEPREPRTDHVTVAFIGGGFAGLLTGARLKEAGVDDVRIIDKAGDFGGTWYWNRYPGAQCDTASFVYMPLLEETGHMPTEKYAHGPEILEHSRRIGKHFGLYDHALFHTEVTSLEWTDAGSRWIVRTNRGDEFTAQFVAMGTGPLHVPKLPGIPGLESFEGHSFHTSRWDYVYTGGSSEGAPMTALADKRVAIIGTGATSVQCVPHLAAACGELFVFQRTPSSVDVRDNRPTDPAWFETIATPGWQKRWLENFTANQTGMMPEEDLVMDGWTDLARRIRERVFSLPADQFTPENMMAAFEDSDFEKMEEIRARVDSIVADPDTAANLKAWYRQLCKRPCFHDEYLQAFNRPNTHLVDTDGKGVSRITPRGVVVGDVEYEVDCIIYASGFEVGTDYTRRAGYDMVGRDGLRLSDTWAEGMRTKHGVHVHGFPNAFFVQIAQGANLVSNVPHNFTEAGTTIAQIVRHAIDGGHTVVEVTREAEDAWMELLLSGPALGVIGSADCTPGYYNNEGQPGAAGRDWFLGYPGGAQAYFQYLDGWRRKGDFAGLEFR